MPNLDTLLGLSVVELEALTDEQLLERFKDIFILEPQVPLTEDKDDDSEDKPTRTKSKVSTSKQAMKDLKQKLLSEDPDKW